MKILYIGDFNLRRGGAERRTYCTLPHISKHFQTAALTSEDVSTEFYQLFKENGISILKIEEVSPEQLIKVCVAEKIDLIVVQKEHPDWIIAAHAASKRLGIRYALLIHTLPIIGTPLKMSTHYRSHAFLTSLLVLLGVLWRLRGNRYDAQAPISNGGLLGGLFKFAANTVKRINATYKAMWEGYILPVGPVSELYVKSYFKGHDKIFALKPGNGFTLPRQGQNLNHEFMYDACYMAARLAKRKGLFDFLKIIHMVSRRRSIRAAIMGRFIDNKTQKRFQAACSKLGIVDNVEYLGFVSEQKKFEVLGASKIFVYPSIIDAFPISLVEALGSGCPSIVWNAPFTIQFESPALFKIPYRDYDAYAQKVLELLNMFDSNQEKYLGLRTTAKRFAEQHRWEDVAAAEVAAYRKIEETQINSTSYPQNSG